MAGKRIPLEALIMLQNSLDALSARHPKRKLLVEEMATLYGVSVSTVHRSIRCYSQPQATRRADYNRPRVISRELMGRYCEVIAALKIRTTNKKGHHLSTKDCIRLLEEPGVETPEGLIRIPKNLLKTSTISRYLNRWGYDRKLLATEPTVVPFQAVHSNECWQFDFSPSDLKKLKSFDTDISSQDSPLMLASVVDDRSGFCYQEYHIMHGEDAQTALRFLYHAMAVKKDKSCPLQGIPKMIYIDAGPVSKSRVFKRVMTYLGIEVRIHMPKGKDGRRTTSRAKGKVERPFRTVKSSLETLYHFHIPETLDEANAWLRHYLERYNAMSHRTEEHSRKEDWIKNLPSEGYRDMCSWKRFSTFAREPEQRRVGSDACVTASGIRYQVSNELAGQDVTLLWGLFDQELFVEYNEKKYGPFYPAEGPIPLGTYRRFKKSSIEKRADKLETLAKHLSISRSALSGKAETEKELLSLAVVENTTDLPSVSFVDPDPFDELTFKSHLDAKLAIAAYLGRPLARLTQEQMAEVNRILSASLDKKAVMAEIKTYFSISIHKESSGRH